MAAVVGISLDIPNRICVSGGTISGKVIYERAIDNPISQVSIVFSGCIEASVFNRDDEYPETYRTQSPLVQEKLILYSSATRTLPEVRSWPFTFSVPSFSNPALHDPVKAFGPLNSWHGTDNPFPLPQSFVSTRETYGSNVGHSSGKVTHQLKAEISYIQEPQWKYPIKPITSIFPLEYRNLRENLWVDPQLHMIEDKAHISTAGLLTGPPVGLKGKMNRFFSSTTPEIEFVMRMIFPTATYAGISLPLQFAIISVAATNDAPAQPEIFINEITVWLNSSQKFRAKLADRVDGKRNAKHTMTDTSDDANVRKLLTVQRGNFLVPHVQFATRHPGVVSLPQVYNTTPVSGSCLEFANLSIPNSSVPSFQSSLIAVKYSLEIEVKVSAGGKSRIFKFRQFPLEVYSVYPPRIDDSQTDRFSMANTLVGE